MSPVLARSFGVSLAHALAYGHKKAGLLEQPGRVLHVRS